MIKLERYTSEFEKEYWQIVNDKVHTNTQHRIMQSCVKFLPDDFFDGESPSFQKLILAPFEKLKRAEEYIEKVTKKKMKAECFDSNSQNEAHINNLYIEIYKAFGSVADAQKNNTSTRVRLVREADLTVCPYCNRDYINCRADKVSGAQLDHFFSRTDYPVFAISLYNLVPVCGNCNRVKSNQAVEFASPFDETIDWDREIIFVYQPKSLDSIKIDIQSTNPRIENNLKVMRIKEAYQIHEQDILELLEKQQAYSKSQQDEFREILHEMKLSDDEVKRIIFGPRLTQKDMRKKPLGKMMGDLHKELNIY